VDSSEVIEHEMQGYRMGQVLNLLGKTISHSKTTGKI